MVLRPYQSLEPYKVYRLHPCFSVDFHVKYSTLYFTVVKSVPLRGILASPNQTLGFAQTHWGTLPQTPSIELPNPSILEGLPRRLADQNDIRFGTSRGLHSECVNSLSSRPLTGSVRYR